MLQGLSLVLCCLNGDDVLVAFGGYNGHYSNEASQIMLILSSFYEILCVVTYKLNRERSQPEVFFCKSTLK